MSLQVIALTFCAVATYGVFAPSASASSYFGTRLLVQGDCCGGADITGDRATITAPNSNFTTTSTLCALQREDMEGNTVPPATGDNRLIQTGLVKCGTSVSGGLDNTCSLSGNLVYYTEVLWSDAYHCTALGQATYSSSHKFSVWESGGSNNIYYTFFDGSKDPTSGYYYVTMPYIWVAVSSGELTSCFSRSDCNSHGSIDVPGTYASSGGTAWQRYDPADSSWHTVQSSPTCAGPSFLTCGGGGWSFVNGPPGPFDIDYNP